MSLLVYDNFKLTHNGIIRYTTFEGIRRKIHHNSLKNLNNYTQITGEISENGKDASQGRNLNPAQSKKLRRYCSKLAYYSQTRVFESKKTGKYKMKVAFLSLGAPEDTTHEQFTKAFNHFLDYLRRTANCVFVWKKELGEKSGKLHVHIMINNFIPYYIVSWKWKRLLIAEGVNWPTNKQGQQTNAHTRIELPRNARQTGAYIAKYMSKAFELSRDCGYIWGKSDILDSCRECVLIEGEINSDEYVKIGKVAKVLDHNYVTAVIIDLLKVKEIAPTIYNIFNEQYINFSQLLTLEQKFRYVD